MDQRQINEVKEAREKYKPEIITYLFIAEAPPSALDRFFYYEKVKDHDSLYLELMGVLFKEIQNSVLSHFTPIPSIYKLRSNKEEYLKRFQEKGYYLIDNLDYPMPHEISNTKEKIKFLEGSKDKLYKKVNSLVDKKTPIVLISVPVFQANAGNLKYYGYNVIHDKAIEFPGSGQQKKFREKMSIIFGE